MPDWPKHGDVVAVGPGKSVAFLKLPDGREPLKAYLSTLEAGPRAKIAYLFEKMANQGYISNTQHFRKLTDTEGVFEFKRDQTRVFCFHGVDRLLLLADGETKKAAKPTRQIVDQCDRWYREYRQSQQRSSQQQAAGSRR